MTTTFSSNLTFAKSALAEACDCLHGNLFGGDAVCARTLDRQLSQFVMLMAVLAAMLGVSALRSFMRM